MKHIVLLAGLLVLGVDCRAAADADQQPANRVDLPQRDQSDCVVLPNRTNEVQFRLYTNASLTAPHLFNTFELEAFGQTLLPSPGDETLQRWRQAAPTNDSLHSVLVNGRGPEPGLTNSLKIVEQASGPDWCYIALDVTPAYRGRLQEYRRGILFVAPDLFVLYDHLVGQERFDFQMLLHPPAATRVDADWHDLRLETPEVGLRISAPSRRELRAWEQTESPADAFLPGTETMRIGPTNQVAQLDMLTVFALQPGGKKMDYVFKLVESNTAVGARIHRDGLPTIVAFRVDPTQANPSLDSFKFAGPVGVSVFRPKRSAP